MPLDQSQIEEAAAFLFHLRVQRQTLPALPGEIAPRSIDDAYDIQDALHDTAGWPIGVIKVGATSAMVQDLLGLDQPIAGRVPGDGVFSSGAAVPGSFFGAPPQLECEIALRIGGDGAPDAWAVAIELVDMRLTSLSGPGLVADNSGSCGVVLGDAHELTSASALDDVAVELHRDDQLVAQGNTAAVAGGASAAYAWAIQHERVRGREPAAGTWVITGSCTGLTPSEPGATYVARFGDLGTVDVTL